MLINHFLAQILVTNHKKYGVYMGSKGFHYWTITGNQFDHNWGAGIGMENVRNVSVCGNSFRRNGGGSEECAEGADSCQIALLNAKGISIVGNSFRAARSDGSKGEITPKFGIWMKESSFCNITSNNLFEGYTEDVVKDAGGNINCLTKDNVGCKV